MNEVVWMANHGRLYGAMITQYDIVIRVKCFRVLRCHRTLNDVLMGQSMTH